MTCICTAGSGTIVQTMTPELHGVNVRAHCPECAGTVTTFEGKSSGGEYASITRNYDPVIRKLGSYISRTTYRLVRCAGCGRAGIAVIDTVHSDGRAGQKDVLVEFYPRTVVRLPLPKGVPDGIVSEFREAESCASVCAYRGAGALLRSVLEKTLKANGYTTERDLKQRIDDAAADGIITAARQRRAHEEVRVLGNDILHDEWKAITDTDYEDAHFYAQRILEDFYDHRNEVEAILKKVGRIKEPPAPQPSAPSPS